MQGRVVKQVLLNAVTQSIPVDDLAAGFYTVLVKNGKSNMFIKN
jgi:hypothetical protein